MRDFPVPQGPAMRTATFSATKRQVASSVMRVWLMATLKSKSNCSIVFEECAGPLPTDDEKFTASDVAVQVEDDTGRAGLILVEVKLSEGGFTPVVVQRARGTGERTSAPRRRGSSLIPARAI